MWRAFSIPSLFALNFQNVQTYWSFYSLLLHVVTKSTFILCGTFVFCSKNVELNSRKLPELKLILDYLIAWTLPLYIPYWQQRWRPAGPPGPWWGLPAAGSEVTAAAVVPFPSHNGWGTSPPPCGPSGLREPGRTGGSYPGDPPSNGSMVR